MVFTINTITAFFTSAAQMGLTDELRVALQGEDISMVEDLGEFENTHWIQVSFNLRNPASIPNPNNSGRQMRPHNFALGARSLKRLKASAALLRYYVAIDRPLTAANMHFTVEKFFILQWKAIQDMKNESDGVVPKLTRNTSCIKWVPIMLELLGTVIGVRDVPLIYVFA